VQRRTRLWLSLVLTLAAVVGAGAAPAGSRQTGTLVVRLATDPSPPGVSWRYSGAGPAFPLGEGGSERTLTLPPGTYPLREAPSQPGQVSALTALTCRDPSGDTTTDVKDATATVVLADGETVTCTFAHRALGARSAAASLALARTYAPVLRLSSGEPYRPIRIEDYLSVGSLHGGIPPHGPLLQPRPRLFSLPTMPGSSYLDVAGAEPTTQGSPYAPIEQRLAAAHPRATVYWHIARQPSAGRVAVEYWFLYLYNDFYDRHEADWEGVTVFLHDGAPLGVSYSAHQGRRWSAWSAQRADGTHPTVYAARGSHANYAAPGRYGIRVCWTLYGRHCSSAPRLDIATGTGLQLSPGGYDLVELGGTPFSGDWGSGTFILGIGRTRDHLTDPRRRSEYSFPFGTLPSPPAG
jgi:hypothetical protein